MEKLLCPSMMCADYDNLAEEVRLLEAAGADVFHCDVMDGSFVPNIAMGLQDIRCIRRNTKKPVDCHLMVDNPGQKLPLFLEAGCDIIYIHPESESHADRTLSEIRAAGRKAGLAIHPDTSLETVSRLLCFADYVMAMTVYPGFAGQKYIEHVTDKVRRLGELKKSMDFRLMIDGACSPERIRELHVLGADGFVLGTSALFGKGKSYAELIQGLRDK